MSTKKTTHTALPALAGGDEEDHREMQPQLRRLRAIQQQYAAAIIAAGVFSSTEIWTGVIPLALALPLLASVRTKAQA